MLKTCPFIGSLLPGIGYSHICHENDTPVEYGKIPHVVGF